MGIELQLEELREQQRRAVVQGRVEDARRMQVELEDLQNELARTADLITGADSDEPPQMHDEEKLAAP